MSNKQHIFHNMTAYEHQTFGMKLNKKSNAVKANGSGLEEDKSCVPVISSFGLM